MSSSGSLDRTYYLTNWRGDVNIVLDNEQDIRASYIYNAFGTEREESLMTPISTSSAVYDTNPIRYAGQYYDSESGNYYLRARYYNPYTGRFTSEDPAQDGLNWYSYCAGNPVGYIDPSGEIIFPVVINSGGKTTGKSFTYNRDAAVEYARSWAEGKNPVYPYYGGQGGDCTNFVSQCLVAGGLPTDGTWKTYKFFGKKKTTRAWDNAQANYNYFSNPKNGFVNAVYSISERADVATLANSGNVQKGDVMYFRSNTTGQIVHAVIITKVENGEIYYCQHSSSPELDVALGEDRFCDENTIGYTIYVVTLKDEGNGYVV